MRKTGSYRPGLYIDTLIYWINIIDTSRYRLKDIDLYSNDYWNRIEFLN